MGGRGGGVDVRMCVYVHACVCVCVCVSFFYLCVCVCVCVLACADIHISAGVHSVFILSLLPSGMDGGAGVQGQVCLHRHIPAATVHGVTNTPDAEAAGTRALQGVAGEKHPQWHRECCSVSHSNISGCPFFFAWSKHIKSSVFCLIQTHKKFSHLY